MNEQDLIKIIDKYSSLLWGHGTESSHLVEFNKKLDKNETKIPSMDYRVFLKYNKNVYRSFIYKKEILYT